MCLIAKNQKKFTSARLKNSLYSFDKSDPKNLTLPTIIESLSDEQIYEVLPKLVEKYKKNNYATLEREELDELHDFSDLEVLILVKFYKNSWSFQIPKEREFFPSFAFTYNVEPLQKEIDKITSFCYDKIDSSLSKDTLKNSSTFSVLQVTYLLHFFVITHENYIED